MSKEAIVITLGLLTALAQFSGFPQIIKDYFYIVAGVAVAAIVFVIRQEHIWKEREGSGEHRANTFVEGGVRAPGTRV